MQNQPAAEQPIFGAGCERQGMMTGCQVCHSDELTAIYGLHETDI